MTSLATTVADTLGFAWKTDHQAALQRIDGLEKALKEAESSLKDEKKKVIRLEGAVRELQEANDGLQSDLETAMANNIAATTANRELTSANRTLSAQVEALQTSLTENITALNGISEVSEERLQSIISLQERVSKLVRIALSQLMRPQNVS